MKVIKYLVQSLAIVWLLQCQHASAQFTEQCVTSGDSGSLITYLDHDNNNGGIYILKLEKGYYQLPGNYIFNQERTTGMVIAGGYEPGYNCDIGHRQLLPANTTIDGMGTGEFAFYSGGTMEVAGITFENFANNLVFYGGSAQYPRDCSAITYTIHHNIFSNIVGGVYAFTNGQATTHDNLFSNNNTAGYVNGFNDTGPAGSLKYEQVVCTGYIFNNTIADTTGDGLVISALYQSVPNTTAHLYASNNVIWKSSGTDVVSIPIGSQATIEYSNFSTSSGSSLVYGSGNIICCNGNTDPLLGSDFSPTYTTSPFVLSPVINKGAKFYPVAYSQIDVAGHTRVVGSSIDMGAFETSYNDRATFVVTDNSDNGSNTSPTSNTLRWALVNAAANTGASQIYFNIPGGCPATIALDSAPLPDITTDVVIDATTQSGWTANTQSYVFDSTLCVLVDGEGAAPWAFHTTGNGRTSIKGLGLDGFTDAAIKLESGQGNVIIANQIGGLASMPANYNGIRITGSASGTFVGFAADPANWNLVSGNINYGIDIDSTAGSNYINNNAIGVAADGKTASPNGGALLISNSPSNIVRGNVISGNAGEGIVIGGSGAIGNLIQQNLIGVVDGGSLQILPNGTGATDISTPGVLIFGASGNTIGAALNSSDASFGNWIVTWGGPQVLVYAGTNNAVVGNGFLASDSYALGKSPLPLLVDLGTPGRGGSNGANQDVPAPVLKNAFQYSTTNNGITTTYNWVEGTYDGVANATYRLDTYVFPGILNIGSITTDGSGHAHFWIEGNGNSYNCSPAVSSLCIATIMATDANGNTSESAVPVPVSTDMIFRDDFEAH